MFRDTAFFWYDPRPGWDKERFRREVFAVNHKYKLFRNGRLFRLTDRPLEEIPVDPLKMTDEDRRAVLQLSAVIKHVMADVKEPPLLDAYGNLEHDFKHVPAGRPETETIRSKLLETGKEFVYGDPNVNEHRLWLFKPLDLQPEEKRPCVVFVHGGGWGGKPSSLAPQAVYLQRRGFITASIHFRAPKGELTPHDTLRDARQAYRWIVKHAAEHQIDIDRLFLSGGSAGGHLSLAMCNIPLKDDPVIEHKPRGLMLFNPVIDLVDGWSGGRKKCKAAGIDARSFSPAHHIVKGLPPVLVMSGGKDQLITPKQLDRFRSAMKEAGNTCDVTIYPEAGHGFFNYGFDGNRYFQPTMWQVDDFLAKHAK